MKPASRLPLTSECHHYYDIGEVPWDIQKLVVHSMTQFSCHAFTFGRLTNSFLLPGTRYWHQRYSIFSYYDDDVQLTDDAWFGVTPEPVAAAIAADLAARQPASHTTLVDLFAGAGGNVIAFALSGRWQRIVAVERDAATLACAQHNAEVYGVPDGLITWVHGDCFEYLRLLRRQQQQQQQTQQHQEGENEAAELLAPELQVDPASTVIFASPPWGGVSYRDQDVFDLSTMQPYNLRQLHDASVPFEHALYLPRTSDLRQIAKLVPGETKVDVRQYCMEGASKAMVAYIPSTTST
ncbi:uncharacterized protein E0L32_004371 [Thyridium curvatum]|uniref:Trimethylguanosine synthase n=1 Tax=Thyridium curvatum TaxID=1093900 RepID=A0A507BEK6_9PEZI|nr:uncharacterized protein E0L32_004371 [Thyridium curvatum]TPX15391.1 hypothetical protein E0L32_004371 [Thyridium curvatum]